MDSVFSTRRRLGRGATAVDWLSSPPAWPASYITTLSSVLSRKAISLDAEKQLRMLLGLPAIGVAAMPVCASCLGAHVAGDCGGKEVAAVVVLAEGETVRRKRQHRLPDRWAAIEPEELAEAFRNRRLMSQCCSSSAGPNTWTCCRAGWLQGEATIVGASPRAWRNGYLLQRTSDARSLIQPDPGAPDGVADSRRFPPQSAILDPCGWQSVQHYATNCLVRPRSYDDPPELLYRLGIARTARIGRFRGQPSAAKQPSRLSYRHRTRRSRLGSEARPHLSVDSHLAGNRVREA